MKVLALAGDGIGPEIMTQALLVLSELEKFGFKCKVVSNADWRRWL